MPILFFNEADAIISKRRSINNSPVSQTENAIQNIILEELENFQGIFIATTNLVKNMDKAFERRFLFKIEFQLPDLKAKAKIWKIKLPVLSESDCEVLAQRFDFSGGQIDNVVRKCEIHEVVHGKSVIFTDIIEFCNNELLAEKSNTAMGFIKD
ncbi:MAG: AAA family ATPase [Bacteroidales bacterium]